MYKRILSTRGVITIAILLLIVVCNIGLSNTSYAASTNTFTFSEIARTIEKAGINVSDSNGNTKFDDDEEMHEWGRTPIYFMANHEIIQGVGNNRFNVKGNATREQAIIIANRAVEKLKV